MVSLAAPAVVTGLSYHRRRRVSLNSVDRRCRKKIPYPTIDSDVIHFMSRSCDNKRFQEFHSLHLSRISVQSRRFVPLPSNPFLPQGTGLSSTLTTQFQRLICYVSPPLTYSACTETRIRPIFERSHQKLNARVIRSFRTYVPVSAGSRG